MAVQPPGEMKPCPAPGRNGATCGKPADDGGLCHSHADWQREHPDEPLQPLRERHEERRRLVQVRLTEAELDAVDDVVERWDGPSRGEVIRQCVRQVLLPERAAEGMVYVTDVPKYVEERARVILGVPSSEAFARLDRGELHGTRAEAELTSLRFFAEQQRKK